MNTTSVMFRSILFSAALISTTCPPTFAAGADAETATYGDWTVRCVQREGLLPCDIVQSVRQKDTQRTIMQMSLAYAPAKNQYAMQILLPLGIMIQPGILIRIDEKSELKDLPVTRCEVQGCFVEKLFGAPELAPLQAGKTGAVSISVQGDRVVSLPISFNGFAKALEEMMSRNKGQSAKSQAEVSHGRGK